jgi:ABC-type uncharacterized transport system permease subunit
MGGIEILASEEVAIEWASWNWLSFWIGVAIAFVLSLVAGFIFACQEADIFAGLLMFGCMLIGVGSLLGIILGKNFVDPTKYETHYKVTIDESVSMTEFNEKYEVLEQEGKIYTVRERE